MNNKIKLNLFINSTSSFIAVFNLVTIFHELGHWIAYKLTGFSPILYHNAVKSNAKNITDKQEIICLAAGPLAGLLIGILAFFIMKKRNKNHFLDLILLWTSLLGFINFFGYLSLTPLSINGDTGKIAEILSLSITIKWFIAIISFLLLWFLIIKTGKKFASFIPNVEKKEKSSFVAYIIALPLVVGSLINTIFAMPVEYSISLIYPATSSFFIFASWKEILRTEYKDKISIVQKKISVHIILFLIIILTINRLLTTGIG
jgi:hypothetical protein